MSRFCLALLCPLAALAVPAAVASPQTFEVIGSFTSFNATAPYITDVGALRGTESIDTTTGLIVGSNLSATFDGSTVYFFSGAPSAQAADPASALPDDPSGRPTVYDSTFKSGSATLQLNLFTDYMSNLAGYGGGPLCAFTVSPCPEYDPSLSSLTDPTDGQVYVFQGDVVPSPMPEPTTLTLVGTGVLTLAGAVRRRVVRRW